jgi:hypothetical protein
VSRKTCPACHRVWPDGKDPADAMSAIYQYRIADFVSGLSAEGFGNWALIFKANDPPMVDLIAERFLDLQAAIDIMDAARDKMAGAGPSLAVTPAVQALPAYVQANANETKEDGLETFPCLNTGRFRVWIQGGALRFEEIDNA